MLRVLHILSKMDAGGAESFIMKVFRSIDRQKVMFDFLVGTVEPGYYDAEIRRLGGRIFYCTPKSENIVRSFYDVFKIVQQNHYRVVFRASEHSLSAIDLLAAALGGAKVRVIRSTNTKANGGIVAGFLHHCFRPLLNQVATLSIAPSSEAAKWLFGQRKLKQGKVVLLHNGVDMESFQFNMLKRKKARTLLGIEDCFVIGHVGRLTAQKNHEFLLDVFRQIKSKQTKAVLLLIGSGELENRLRDKAHQLGIAESTKILGVRSDIPDLLMAMDVLIFPSLYEGMPNSVIEAQATGLCCLVSDKITQEVKITDLVHFLPLQAGAEYWADTALKLGEAYLRSNRATEFEEKQYTIQATAHWLKEYYLTAGREINDKRDVDAERVKRSAGPA